MPSPKITLTHSLVQANVGIAGLRDVSQLHGWGEVGSHATLSQLLAAAGRPLHHTALGRLDAAGWRGADAGLLQHAAAPTDVGHLLGDGTAALCQVAGGEVAV